MRALIYCAGWSGQLGLDLALMYRPVVETLVEGFARTHEVEARSGEWEIEPETLSKDDVFVMVGPAGWDRVPFEAIRSRGVRIVMYQTEPLNARLPDWIEQQLRCGAEELWDYSHANLKKLAPAAKSAGVRLRYVPPGYASSLDHGTRSGGVVTSPVVFLGTMWAERPRSFVRLRAEGLPLEHVEGVFRPEELSDLCSSRTVFLNLHKHAGDPSQPAEMLRCSLLLSNRTILISETCDEDDMRELEGLVNFSPLEGLRERGRTLSVHVEDDDGVVEEMAQVPDLVFDDVRVRLDQEAHAQAEWSRRLLSRPEGCRRDRRCDQIAERYAAGRASRHRGSPRLLVFDAPVRDDRKGPEHGRLDVSRRRRLSHSLHGFAPLLLKPCEVARDQIRAVHAMHRVRTFVDDDRTRAQRESVPGSPQPVAIVVVFAVAPPELFIERARLAQNRSGEHDATKGQHVAKEPQRGTGAAGEIDDQVAPASSEEADNLLRVRQARGHTQPRVPAGALPPHRGIQEHRAGGPWRRVHSPAQIDVPLGAHLDIVVEDGRVVAARVLQPVIHCPGEAEGRGMVLGVVIERVHDRLHGVLLVAIGTVVDPDEMEIGDGVPPERVESPNCPCGSVPRRNDHGEKGLAPITVRHESRLRLTGSARWPGSGH